MLPLAPEASASTNSAKRALLYYTTIYFVMIVPALPLRASSRCSISVMMPVLPDLAANLAAASTLGSMEPALKYPYFLRRLISLVDTVVSACCSEVPKLV